MELLDRYLQAVKKHLPRQRQDDIIAELRANLESQLEDKEAGLGRPLTQGETEDWLRQIGPPMLVAARYQPQQYLIGPAVFPIYWYVLRTAFFWAAIIYTIVSAVLIALGTPTAASVAQALVRLPGILVTVAAWVTLVFAAIEFATTRYPEKCPAIPGLSAKWSPSELPPLEKPAPDAGLRSFAHAVAEVVFGVLLLVWLLLIPQYPFLLFGPGAAYLRYSPFTLAPVWVQFYWWVVALNVLQLGWRCLNLWRGSWQQPQHGQHIAVKAFGLIPLALLLTARDHALVALKHPALDQLRHGGTVNTIDQVTHGALLVVGAIAVLQLAWDIGRAIRDAYRKRSASR